MQPNALQHENLHAISENIFDVSQWRDRCQKIAADAGNNCGQSHGLYVQRITEMVNFALKEVAEENRCECERRRECQRCYGARLCPRDRPREGGNGILRDADGSN